MEHRHERGCLCTFFEATDTYGECMPQGVVRHGCHSDTEEICQTEVKFWSVTAVKHLKHPDFVSSSFIENIFQRQEHCFHAQTFAAVRAVRPGQTPSLNNEDNDLADKEFFLRYDDSLLGCAALSECFGFGRVVCCFFCLLMYAFVFIWFCKFVVFSLFIFLATSTFLQDQ